MTIVGRRLRHLRVQTFLAVAALSTAVALPVILLSVGGGVAQHEISSLENAGYEIVLSGPGTHPISSAHRLAEALPREISDVAAASPVLTAALVVQERNGSIRPVVAEGVIPEAFTATLGDMSGALFPTPLPLGDPTDLVHFDNGSYGGPVSPYVLVSERLLAALGLTVGSTLPVAPSSPATAWTNYTIRGTFELPPPILGPTAAFDLLLPLSNLQVLTHTTTFDQADTVDVGLVPSAAADPATIQNVAAQIQAKYPNYAVSTLTQQASQIESVTAILTGFYLALSAVGLTVGLVFLIVLLTRRVESDQQNLGIQRALGVPARRLSLGLVREGALLGAIAGGGGVVVGVATVRALAVYGSPAVQAAARLAVFSPETLTALALVAVGLSVVASAVAGRAILRIRIVEALR